MRKLIKFFKDTGPAILFVGAIAIVAGLAGGVLPVLWFYRGICLGQ